MGRTLDRWMAAGSAALVLTALLACKKKEEAPAPSASVAAAPAPAPAASSAAPAATDDVTRYGDKETKESGTKVVAIPNLAVYQAADTTSKKLTTLAKGTWVNLKASYSNWYLVDYPSGVGELSPGWIQRNPNYYHAATAAEAASAQAAASAAAAAASASAATTNAAAASASAAAAAASASAAAAAASASAAAAAAAASASAAAPKPTGHILHLPPHIQIKPK